MTGKVYFVSAPGRVKVGYTRKPELRLAQLRAVDMEELSVVAIIDGTRPLEAKIQKILKHLNIRGEWFRDCPELRAIIDDAVAGRIEDESKHHFEARAERTASPQSHSDGLAPVFSALKKLDSLAIEITARMHRREPITDLVDQVEFLTNNIVGPALYPERF